MNKMRGNTEMTPQCIDSLRMDTKMRQSQKESFTS